MCEPRRPAPIYPCRAVIRSSAYWMVWWASGFPRVDTVMAELWTFSGINSWNEEQEMFVDYVSAALFSSGVAPGDGNATSFVSELGTRDHYTGSNRLSLLDSERKLDKEADEFAETAVGQGQLAGRHVCAMFIAPKTDTVPTAHFECAVYWTPDGVPNQSAWEWPASAYWERWADTMPRGEPRPRTYAVSASHGLGTFLHDSPALIEWREVKRGPRGKGRPAKTPVGEDQQDRP